MIYGFVYLRVSSPERNKAISEAHKGRIKSPEHVERLREAAKKDWAKRKALKKEAA